MLYLNDHPSAVPNRFGFILIRPTESQTNLVSSAIVSKGPRLTNIDESQIAPGLNTL